MLRVPWDAIDYWTLEEINQRQEVLPDRVAAIWSLDTP
jgi:hypothetical protein